jgi:hypothetical protein
MNLVLEATCEVQSSGRRAPLLPYAELLHNPPPPALLSLFEECPLQTLPPRNTYTEKMIQAPPTSNHTPHPESEVRTRSQFMKISSARPVRESSHTTPKFQCKWQIEGKNAVRRLRPRAQSAKDAMHPSVRKKKEIQDMDGHGEH